MSYTVSERSTLGIAPNITINTAIHTTNIDTDSTHCRGCVESDNEIGTNTADHQTSGAKPLIWRPAPWMPKPDNQGQRSLLKQLLAAIASLLESISSLIGRPPGDTADYSPPAWRPPRSSRHGGSGGMGGAGGSNGAFDNAYGTGKSGRGNLKIDKKALAPNASAKDLEGALKNRNVQAFLKLIRTGEGTLGKAGYRTMFGGSRFNDFSNHPYRAISASGITSTAAGAYQFLDKTWNSVSKQYGLPDFSPHSQDIAALALIKQRGALGDVMAGRFDVAIAKCNKEWASLPGSPYGQPTLTYNKARQVLASAGANFA